MITSYGISEAGLIRPVNEDCILVGTRLFVLADGMGGYEGGQLASSTAVAAVKQYFDAHPDTVYSESAMREAVLFANHAILYQKVSSGTYQEMGTTLILAAIAEDHLYWAHVGDSRLYIWNAGRLTQITKDHSFVMTLVDEGKISREEMRAHPRKNEITRAVGIRAALEVDTGTIALDSPMMILICSDGLSTPIDDNTITEAFNDCGRGEEALKACAEQLLKKVYEAGASDNISAILVQYIPDELNNGAES